MRKENEKRFNETRIRVDGEEKSLRDAAAFWGLDAIEGIEFLESTGAADAVDRVIEHLLNWYDAAGVFAEVVED